MDEEEQVDAGDIEVIENDRLEELEDKISRQKYLIRTVAIGIMFATAIILIVT